MTRTVRPSFPILRWLLGLALLAALAAGVLMVPGVQRALVIRALKASGATDIEVGRFHATPLGLQTAQFGFRRGSLRLTASSLDFALSWRDLLRRRLRVTRVEAGAVNIAWDLDAGVSPAAAGARSAAPSPAPPDVPFPGLLRMLDLPLPLSIDTAELDGSLTLARGSAPLVHGRWRLHNGRLAAGRAGAIAFSIDVKLPGAGPAGPAHVEGSVEIASTAEGESYTANATLSPDVTMGLAGSFSSDSQTAEVHATLSSREATNGRAPPALKPLLAALGSLSGSVDATLRRASGAWMATRASASISGGPQRTRVSVDLDQPLALAGRPRGLTQAVLRIERLPMAWANAWLASSGVRLDPCELSGSWTVTATDTSAVFAPETPLSLTPVRLEGPSLPAMGALAVQARARLQATREGLAVSVRGLRIGTETGQRLEVGAELAGSWAPGSAIRLNAFEATLRRASGDPVADLQTVRPLALSPGAFVPGLENGPPGPLARLTLRDLPLGWLTRFLPGRRIEGIVTEGESVIANVAGKGLVLTSPAPWNVADLQIEEGGRRFFDGSLAAAPTVVYGSSERSVRFERLNVEDIRGYRVRGRVGIGLRGSDDRVGGGVTLQAELPHFKGAGPGTGPLRLDIRAQAHVFPGPKGELARLTATLADPDGKTLFAIASEKPVTFERTPAFEWLVSSPAPLRITTGTLPLSWANPYLEPRGLSIDGAVPATELQLTLSPRRLVLESRAPLQISRFHLERDGSVLIDRALLRLGAALDLHVEHRLLPAFSMKTSAELKISDGVVAAEGSRVARFGGQLCVSATERSASLHDLAGSLWLDLGALGKLPFLAGARLPAAGELTASVRKDQERARAVQFDARLDKVAGRDGASVPPLVLAGRAFGNVEKGVGGFGVTATLLASPRPSDLHFAIKVDYGHLSVVDLSSKLEGSFLDVDAVRSFAAAFAPAPRPEAPPAPPASPAAPPPSPSRAPSGTSQPGAASSLLARARAAVRPADGPAWGSLRGHFTLGIKTVSFAPYLVENVVGRLDVTADSMTLTNLSGDILGGKWSADVAAHFNPADSAGRDSLEAHLRFAQVDAGRAIRMRYARPSAGIDGRLDADIVLASRADRWSDLLHRATGSLSLAAHGGRIRLKLPDSEMISTGLLVGGALTLSGEMRALGRLVGRLSDIPISDLQATGRLEADGRLDLERLRVEAPELELVASGSVADAKTRNLMNQPLAVRATLSADGDLAVILKGMRMLGPRGADGFAEMKQPFQVGGSVGQPDFHPLYELLARAVDGSRGTWGMLMRKVQSQVAKRPPAS